MAKLYLSQPGLKVNLNHGKFIVSLSGETLHTVPELYVEGIVVMAPVQVTYAVTASVLERGGTITYLARNGDVQGILGLDVQQGRQVLLQAAAHLDPAKKLQVARGMLQRKLQAQRQLLLRYNKSLHSDELTEAAERLQMYAERLTACTGVKAMLGIEGTASKEYYDCFPLLLKNSDYTWEGRSRRPPRDPVNSMLSFAYGLVERAVQLEVMHAGLTCGIGFLHGVNDYKNGFVYDVMESFRTLAAERTVFRCINRRIFSPDDFDRVGDACYLSSDARKRFIIQFSDCAREKGFYGTNLSEAIKKELLLIRKEFGDDTVDFNEDNLYEKEKEVETHENA